MIKVCGLTAYLDFILAPEYGYPAIISFYDRSLQVLKSIAANLNEGSRFDINYKQFVASGEYDVLYTPIITGKDKFYHAIAISKNINKTILVCKEDEQEVAFYNFLMKNFNLPLMKKWSGAIYNWCLRKDLIRCNNDKYFITGQFPVSSDAVRFLKDLRVYTVHITHEVLEDCIRDLFKDGCIRITDVPQKKLVFSNLDTYLNNYGSSLAKNLEKSLKPLTDLNGNIDYFVFNNMRLYPQQAAQVNGILALLQKSRYGIMNEECGTGKTIQSCGVVEGYFALKYIKSHPGITLKDLYQSEDILKYRVIVICPGHLTAKWAHEIKSQVPFSRVTVLTELSQLIYLREKGRERKCREFFIISKDFAKLNYMMKPTPIKRRYWHIMKKVCNDCGNDVYTPGTTCPFCDSNNLNMVKSGYKGEGMVCPQCKNILIPYKTARLQSNLYDHELTQPLDHFDFTNQCESNSKCYYCDTELWQPHMASLGESKRANIWYRATHYTNKAHKGKKTVWVHKDFADEYFTLIGERPLNEIDREGVRKFAPGAYIKKYLKGYFDIAIIDEAHLFKSGSSAQANTMAAILSASKKHIAMTGTIAGGVASDLFYLLYRLDPKRMLSKGFKWGDEYKFVEKYGVIEKAFELKNHDSEASYNVSSKGRQKGSPRVKPGISPLIFIDFLMDKTVFLGLDDLSKYLPELKEYVELVEVNGDIKENPEKEMHLHYRKILDSLKMHIREKDGGRGILSTMLQFSLSYLDKPYGVSAIKSPKNGAILAEPKNFFEFSKKETLLSKEKRLLEIVRKELSENRNIVIYAEYTGTPETCVTHRIKEVLEFHIPDLKGKVEILESSYPPAAKREAWMHEKAAEGIKIFITNPRNVETGLDFCFTHNGISYNYPTLIFYQLGYSLFTIWQASRRHYRLNQRKECRTYYMANKGTIQQAVISLIAEKMAATSAIQGKFSTEGLTAMANGVDARMKLVQALVQTSSDENIGSNLQEMFDVINSKELDDSKYNNYKPMLTLQELIRDLRPDSFDTSIANDISEDVFDIFDMLDSFDDFLNYEVDKVVSEVFVQVDNDDIDSVKPILPKVKSKRVSYAQGQMALF